jgi:hypothetical protein
LIGYRWKCSDVWSRVILITQKLLDVALCKTIFTNYILDNGKRRGFMIDKRQIGVELG